MGQETNVIGKNCSTCHFLASGGQIQEPFEHSVILSTQQRANLDDGGFFKDLNIAENCVYCARRVWSVGMDPKGADKVKQAIFQVRGDDCFYFPYSPGMSCPVAAELERRAADRREAERDRKLTRRAFWVAFAALIVSILATIANCIWNIWAYSHPVKP